MKLLVLLSAAFVSFSNVLAFENNINLDQLINDGMLIDERIIGGTPINNGDQPHMAFLIAYKNSTMVSLCSGSIISTTAILTAASCLVQGAVTADRVYYLVGDVDLGHPNYFNITNMITIHPGYVALTNTNNIAIVKPSSPLVFSATVNSIPLVSASLIATIDSFAGTPAIFCGWGFNTTHVRTVLPCTTLTVMTQKNCRCAYRAQHRTVDDQLVCTEVASSGGCLYDQGSPLLYMPTPSYTPVLFAIYTGNDPACPTIFPGLFTRIGPFLSWIASNIGPAGR